MAELRAPDLSDEKTEATQPKHVEAGAWAVFSALMSAEATANFIEHGHDAASYGPASIAVITGALALKSFRGGRKQSTSKQQNI